MTDWTADELARIGRANELRIATARRDGSLRSDLPIWAVRVGDRIVIRSWKGTDGAWYRQAQRTGRGRIASGGVTKDVTIADGSALDRSEVDAAYRAKFGSGFYTDRMVSDASAETTLIVDPA
ncbi:MAG TPA: DUF2255 family protein [Microbacterium sp.]|nr:DUF2255 family protein [Microbacterium sp.]